MTHLEDRIRESLTRQGTSAPAATGLLEDVTGLPTGAPRHRGRLVVAGAAAAVAAVLVASVLVSRVGGDPDVAPGPGPAENELARHGGQFCPAALPRASQETHGFGPSEAAPAAPSLWEPQQAYVCSYAPKDAAPAGSNGAWFTWVRQGQPRRLGPGELTTLAGALDELKPPSGTRACTADLGRRYLVSYAYENDLTGVVVDSYGCGEIRLTDDPFRTVAGDSSGHGTVPGVLDGPTAIFEGIAAVAAADCLATDIRPIEAKWRDDPSSRVSLDAPAVTKRVAAGSDRTIAVRVTAAEAESAGFGSVPHPPADGYVLVINHGAFPVRSVPMSLPGGASPPRRPYDWLLYLANLDGSVEGSGYSVARDGECFIG